MGVFLQQVLLGDRARRAPGWLVVHAGALRGILSRADDGEVVLTLACDRRIRTDDPLIFRDLREAHAWLARRLRPGGRRGGVSTEGPRA